MAKQSNQKLRVLHIADILKRLTNEQHCLRTCDIIALLEDMGIPAERKTIYDDMEKLSGYGMDIINKPGKSGGYYLATGDFELPELKLLVDAVQASKFITKKKSAQLIQKIEGLTNKYDASALQRQVYAINRVKAENESVYYNIDSLHEAIHTQKQIEFAYYEQVVDFNLPQKHELRPKSSEKYKVSPMALLWDDENYYMVGYSHNRNQTRHYRVDKMRDISVTNRAVDIPQSESGFDPSQYSKTVFGMFGGDEKEITIRFKNSLIGAITDFFGDGIFISPDGEEHFRIHVTVKTSRKFYSWLFSFGGDAQIISPTDAIIEYKNHVLAAMKNY